MKDREQNLGKKLVHFISGVGLLLAGCTPSFVSSPTEYTSVQTPTGTIDKLSDHVYRLWPKGLVKWQIDSDFDAMVKTIVKECTIEQIVKPQDENSRYVVVQNSNCYTPLK